MFGVKLGADGVNVATVLAAFMATVPGTLIPEASLSVNVTTVPAGAELSVTGFMAWLKIATTEVATPAFWLVATLVAPFDGLADRTVGSVDVPPVAPTAPGATVAPGAAAVPPPPELPPPPPPQPARAAAIKAAQNHVSDLAWV